MDTLMLVLQFIVLLAAIFLGVRLGGIAIGYAGGLGVVVLSLALGMEPGVIPWDVILIIMSVIAAITAMQVAGGLDYLVQLAERALRKNPKQINYLAPTVTYLLTLFAGTGHTAFSMIPVIVEVAKEQNIKPSAPLALAVVSSQIAITASPVSAAVIFLSGVLEPLGVSYPLLLGICIPTTYLGCMIAAFIINKFRGDKSILEPGLVQLEKLTGIDVLGVLPYEKFNIDEEDSLAETLKNTEKGLIDIAVIKLPRISNFTDFAVFEYYEGVKVRYINDISDFGEPDLLIIPGTKNTIDDMRYIRSSGLITKIMQYAETGKGIIGVCGGYQMLTSKICDPDNMESGGSVQGLGLIKAETVFEKEKIRTVVQGKFNNIKGYFSFLNGACFAGYEIHMGKTYSENSNISEIKDSFGNIKSDGLAENNILGTYIHGIFDEGDVVKRIIDKLKQEKGIDTATEEKDINELKNKEYEKLADMLMNYLNIPKIYEILEKGV